MPTLPKIEKFSDNLEKSFDDKADIYGKFQVKKVNDHFVIISEWLENLLKSINFADSYSRAYFEEKLAKFGVNDALKKIGANNGDMVKIGDSEFEFFE